MLSKNHRSLLDPQATGVNFYRRWCVLFLLSVSVLLSACGSGEAVVREAAQQRWNALIAGDLPVAYQYYTDAFKETVSLKRFRTQTKGVGLWNKAQVETINCDESGKRCHAKVEVTVSMKMRGLPKPVETSDVIEEIWIKEGVFSDWRYVKK